MAAAGAGAIRVLCFGALRERLGAETLIAERVATVAELWSVLTRDSPSLRDARERVRAARNLAWCDWQTPVEPGDEIAFMPPVAGGAADGAAAPRLRVRLVGEPIDAGRLAAEIRTDQDGAVASFVGVVRAASAGSPVLGLDYEAYLPMAERELFRIASLVASRHPVTSLTMVHRVGSLAVGEVSVAVAAAAPHRRPAIAACAEAIEILKHDLPVWKREHHPDGAVWVDARELDPGAAGEPEPSPGASPAAAGEASGQSRDPGAGVPSGEAPPSLPQLSHVDGGGELHMVDVSDRSPTLRQATAEAVVRFSSPATVAALRRNSPKGDVLAVARLAGIMAAKRTPDLIPLCHPLPITHVDVTIEIDDAVPGVRILSTARCVASTGVEMEALTAASVAALTVIDMLKSADPWMTISWLGLRRKSGGKSGAVERPA